MPDSETLLVDAKDAVAHLTLNRPSVLNAMNDELRRALAAEIWRLDQCDEVRVVVIRGAGRSFCAGQDQNESRLFNAEEAARRIETYVDLFRALRDLNKPLVAAIHGYAVGAGL